MKRIWVVVHVEDACPNQSSYFLEEAETAEEALKNVCERENLVTLEANGEGYGAFVIGYVAVYLEHQAEGKHFQWDDPVVGGY